MEGRGDPNERCLLRDGDVGDKLRMLRRTTRTNMSNPGANYCSTEIAYRYQIFVFGLRSLAESVVGSQHRITYFWPRIRRSCTGGAAATSLF